MILSHQIVKLILNDDEILIEYRDLKWFAKYKFYVVQGRGQSKYLKANLPDKSRTVELHRLIMNPPKGMEVDHINRNGLDNRRTNLRIVDHQTNQSNLPKKRNSSSKYYGVSKLTQKTRNEKGFYWQAGICFKNKRKNLGHFKTENEAAIAYDNYIIINKIDKNRNFYD